MSEPLTEDAAWAATSVPVPPGGVCEYVGDVERLLRSNPYIEYDRLVRDAAGLWHASGRNESNEQAFAWSISVADALPTGGLSLRYSNGIKRETRCDVAADGAGSRVTLTEHYETLPEAGRSERLAEVDRSLVPWAASLRTALCRRQRWGWLPGYGAGERFWLTMPPRHRRLAWLLTWTTAAEFVVFVALVVAYRLAQ